jgi:hypothetical protein
MNWIQTRTRICYKQKKLCLDRFNLETKKHSPEESPLVGRTDELDGRAQPLADILGLEHEVLLPELAACYSRLVGDEDDLGAAGAELLQLARHLRVQNPPVVRVCGEHLHT